MKPEPTAAHEWRTCGHRADYASDAEHDRDCPAVDLSQAGIEHPAAEEGVPFDPGTGPIPGYYAGRCGHRVAIQEWRAGFRTCERCPDPEAVA